MMLPKLFWRRFRCADCGHTFELPLDHATFPPHTRPDGTACSGCDAVPV
jgi:hypothetical protein